MGSRGGAARARSWQQWQEGTLAVATFIWYIFWGYKTNGQLGVDGGAGGDPERGPGR